MTKEHEKREGRDTTWLTFHDLARLMKEDDDGVHDEDVVVVEEVWSWLLQTITLQFLVLLLLLQIPWLFSLMMEEFVSREDVKADRLKADVATDVTQEIFNWLISGKSDSSDASAPVSDDDDAVEKNEEATLKARQEVIPENHWLQKSCFTPADDESKKEAKVIEFYKKKEHDE